MKIKDLTRILEHAVPLEWALPDDPVGLQVGDPEREIRRIMPGLEMSTHFLEEAVRLQADFLLVHHPLIFRPLRRLLESDPVQRLARELIRRELALYAMHTNLDLHPQGMAPLWARKLGCARVTPLTAKPQAARLKLVTFVPPEHTDRVREALGRAGAGIIGEYDQCSFTSRGTGTFRGSGRANPFLGRAGAFERADEDRLEMVLPVARKWAVIQALYQAHPYEEPAYDLYALEDARDMRQALWIAEFDRKLSWSEFEKRIMKSRPGLKSLGGVRPDRRRQIRRAALSTGSGNSMLPLIYPLDVDVFLTGEMGYHYLWEAKENRLNVITIGHDFSETLFAETVTAILEPLTRGTDILWLKSR
ncbi:MAG: Nif3-like dinuclear metal center hexameric protein [bacterium]